MNSPIAWLEAVARDLRHSVRLLAKTPAFTLSAAALLALGISAGSTVFSLVNVFLFQLAKTGIANAKIEGLWENAPTPANDLSKVRWTE